MVGLAVLTLTLTISIVGVESDTITGVGKILLGGELSADLAEEDAADDVTASCVYHWKSTRDAVEQRFGKTADGRWTDSSTFAPFDGQYEMGHVLGQKWWRTQQLAREGGWTRQELIEYEDNPDRLQIENPVANRCHMFEMPR